MLSFFPQINQTVNHEYATLKTVVALQADLPKSNNPLKAKTSREQNRLMLKSTADLLSVSG